MWKGVTLALRLITNSGACGLLGTWNGSLIGFVSSSASFLGRLYRKPEVTFGQCLLSQGLRQS